MLDNQLFFINKQFSNNEKLYNHYNVIVFQQLYLCVCAGSQERLKLARRRRMQQLKKWSQNEKEFTTSKKEKTLLNEAQKKRRESGKGVVFVASVMLLEAAARNDIDEGT